MIAVIQARMSSTRLPGKALKPLGGKPVLNWVIDAARQSDSVADVVVATSTDQSDDLIADHCLRNHIEVIRGPLNDVLARYLTVADAYSAEALMRLTADCPLLDPRVLDAVGTVFDDLEYRASYVSNTIERTLPAASIAKWSACQPCGRFLRMPALTKGSTSPSELFNDLNYFDCATSRSSRTAATYA